MKAFKTLARKQDGQTMAEYGLLLVLIALAGAAIALLLGREIADVFQRVINAL